MDDWPFLTADGETEAYDISGNMLVSSGAILRQPGGKGKPGRQNGIGWALCRSTTARSSASDQPLSRCASCTASCAAEVAPRISPGVVLSHPPINTTPSTGCGVPRTGPAATA